MYTLSTNSQQPMDTVNLDNMKVGRYRYILAIRYTGTYLPCLMFASLVKSVLHDEKRVRASQGELCIYL